MKHTLKIMTVKSQRVKRVKLKISIKIATKIDRQTEKQIIRLVDRE